MNDMTDRLSNTAGQIEVLHLLRLLKDGQQEVQSISKDTLATVLPLTALLDLLHRPQDQHQELGRRLAEALEQIVAILQTLAREVTLTTQAQEIESQLGNINGVLSRLETRQTELLTRLGALERQNAQLAADLFEDPPVPAQF